MGEGFFNVPRREAVIWMPAEYKGVPADAIHRIVLEHAVTLFGAAVFDGFGGRVTRMEVGQMVARDVAEIRVFVPEGMERFLETVADRASKMLDGPVMYRGPDGVLHEVG